MLETCCASFILPVVCNPLKDALTNFLQSSAQSSLSFSRDQAVAGLSGAVSRGRDAAEVVPCPPASAIIGREEELAEIRRHLRDDRVGIIGIYGMAGIGKTTVLSLINNEFFRRWCRGFDLVIWVSVSAGETSIVKLQCEVGSRVGLSLSSERSSSSWTDLVERQRPPLFKALLKKRFLLLLDDVTEKLNFGDIGIPAPDEDNKCKIVFTTRSLQVCNEMPAARKVELRLLDEVQSWELFGREAGGDEAIGNPGVRGLAKSVAAQCGGLPLLLVATRRIMADKRLCSEWEHARDRMGEVGGLRQAVLPHLKKSFDSLKDDYLRSCLLYCSLFPGGHEIDKGQLVDYWTGEGFLDNEEYCVEGVDSARRGGHTIIRELQSTCLLESTSLDDEEERVKLHVSVRLMSSWLTSARSGVWGAFLLPAGKRLLCLPDTSAWRNATRVSLMQHEIRDFPADVIPDCPSLVTLLMNGDNKTSVPGRDQALRHEARKERESVISFPPPESCDDEDYHPKTWTLQIGKEASRIHLCSASSLGQMAEERARGLGLTRLPDGFFQSMPALRVLDLSHTSIDRLPSSVGSLGELRHLNASFTGITSLAVDLGKLVKLRHLDLRCTRELSDVPREAVAGLRALQVLKTHGSAHNWFWVRRATRPVVALKDLEDLHGLDELGLDLDNIVPFGRLIRSPKLAKSTRHLGLSEMKGLRAAHLMEAFEKLEQLRELRLDGCLEVEDLHVRSNQLTRLEVLRFFDLPRLTAVTVEKDDLGPLRNIRRLYIARCHQLRELPWAGQLPSLVEVHVCDCERVEKLAGKEEGGHGDRAAFFPRLRKMRLNDLPRLTGVAPGGGGSPRVSFPSLETLEVRRCPRLRRLPLRAEGAGRLKALSGEQEWWDRLVWECLPDGDELRPGLASIFRPS